MIYINGNDLTIEQVIAVSRQGETVAIAPEAAEKIRAARAYVDRKLADKAVVYGLTTGFGKFSTVFVPEEETAQLQRNLIISHACGMMGSGKSHIGRKLAQRLGWQFVDTDRRIERAVGMTIAEFFASSGEKVFREREINVLQQVSRYHEAVISFGGNFPMNVGTYRILHRHGFIVALLSEPFRVEERVSRHIGKRPTVDYENLHDFVHTMMKQWEEVYPYCDCVIDTTRGGASQIVESIVHKINERHVQFIAREKKEIDEK